MPALAQVEHQIHPLVDQVGNDLPVGEVLRELLEGWMELGRGLRHLEIPRRTG